ncbi:very short patch repair endonuclease [Xanthomonas sp. A2111]|uniref:very short patch repair endonuclease n=1 Tax=Xanthomonas hawaiiensis TaxID=3003247 RepID=UPI001AD971A2|nr:very short patch repair endonuclease [Xanthomonas sp. A2111]
MVDRLTPEQRRRCMSANRGADTGPELALRKALHSLGCRYTLRSKMPGRPDLVFPSSGTVVFVDGCFWHGCPDHCVLPNNNRELWQAKLEANKSRDRRVDEELKRLGWKVVRVWEHEIRRDIEGAAHRIRCIHLQRKAARCM